MGLARTFPFLLLCFTTMLTLAAGRTLRNFSSVDGSDDDSYSVDIKYRSCRYNTYMCCWTENDGDGMEDNTDVCSVDGETYPGDSEGEVHCHGLVWPKGSQNDDYILPLAQYVQVFDHVDQRGYFGNIPGASMCDCIENMPKVTRADCTRHDGSGGFVACENNDLRTHYENSMASPGGELTTNLVGTCEEEGDGDLYSLTTSSTMSNDSLVSSIDDLYSIEIDYGTCKYNIYMCCWTENDGDGMEDNTDVCRVNSEVDFPGVTEGDVHCHGLAWPKDSENDDYVLPLADYVQNFDHKDQRGYYGHIPDAPMCGCIEDMPEVSRADCTHHDGSGGFVACKDNDLRTHYQDTLDSPGGRLKLSLVEECDNE